MTFVIILLVIIVALVVAAVMMYNGLVKQRNTVQEAWHQIDVELTRRHDLIPNLVETVKAYAKHEAGTLDGLISSEDIAIRAAGMVAHGGAPPMVGGVSWMASLARVDFPGRPGSLLVSERLQGRGPMSGPRQRSEER